MRKDEKDRCIKKIKQKVIEIKDPVAKHCGETIDGIKELALLGEVAYLPTPFEIADYYSIKCEFIKLPEDMPSYLDPEKNIIYISKKYDKDSYEARILCAHELGHYFLHDNERSAMNNDRLNKYLPDETKKEYEANVFSILLMPQIMADLPWTEYAPNTLNRIVYNKVLDRNN